MPSWKTAYNVWRALKGHPVASSVGIPGSLLGMYGISKLAGLADKALDKSADRKATEGMTDEEKRKYYNSNGRGGAGTPFGWLAPTVGIGGIATGGALIGGVRYMGKGKVNKLGKVKPGFYLKKGSFFDRHFGEKLSEDALARQNLAYYDANATQNEKAEKIINSASTPSELVENMADLPSAPQVKKILKYGQSHEQRKDANSKLKSDFFADVSGSASAWITRNMEAYQRTFPFDWQERMQKDLEKFTVGSRQIAGTDGTSKEVAFIHDPREYHDPRTGFYIPKEKAHELAKAEWNARKNWNQGSIDEFKRDYGFDWKPGEAPPELDLTNPLHKTVWSEMLERYKPVRPVVENRIINDAVIRHGDEQIPGAKMTLMTNDNYPQSRAVALDGKAYDTRGRVSRPGPEKYEKGDPEYLAQFGGAIRGRSPKSITGERNAKSYEEYVQPPVTWTPIVNQYESKQFPGLEAPKPGFNNALKVNVGQPVAFKNAKGQLVYSNEASNVENINFNKTAKDREKIIDDAINPLHGEMSDKEFQFERGNVPFGYNANQPYNIFSTEKASLGQVAKGVGQNLFGRFMNLFPGRAPEERFAQKINQAADYQGRPTFKNLPNRNVAEVQHGGMVPRYGDGGDGLGLAALGGIGLLGGAGMAGVGLNNMAKKKWRVDAEDAGVTGAGVGIGALGGGLAGYGIYDYLKNRRAAAPAAPAVQSDSSSDDGGPGPYDPENDPSIGTPPSGPPEAPFNAEAYLNNLWDNAINEAHRQQQTPPPVTVRGPSANTPMTPPQHGTISADNMNAIVHPEERHVYDFFNPTTRQWEHLPFTQRELATFGQRLKSWVPSWADEIQQQMGLANRPTRVQINQYENQLRAQRQRQWDAMNEDQQQAEVDRMGRLARPDSWTPEYNYFLQQAAKHRDFIRSRALSTNYQREVLDRMSNEDLADLMWNARGSNIPTGTSFYRSREYFPGEPRPNVPPPTFTLTGDDIRNLPPASRMPDRAEFAPRQAPAPSLFSSSSESSSDSGGALRTLAGNHQHGGTVQRYGWGGYAGMGLGLAGGAGLAYLGAKQAEKGKDATLPFMGSAISTLGGLGSGAYQYFKNRGELPVVPPVVKPPVDNEPPAPEGAAPAPNASPAPVVPAPGGGAPKYATTEIQTDPLTPEQEAEIIRDQEKQAQVQRLIEQNAAFYNQYDPENGNAMYAPRKSKRNQGGKKVAPVMGPNAQYNINTDDITGNAHGAEVPRYGWGGVGLGAGSLLAGGLGGYGVYSGIDNLRKKRTTRGVADLVGGAASLVGSGFLGKAAWNNFFPDTPEEDTSDVVPDPNGDSPRAVNRNAAKVPPPPKPQANPDTGFVDLKEDPTQTADPNAAPAPVVDGADIDTPQPTAQPVPNTTPLTLPKGRLLKDSTGKTISVAPMMRQKLGPSGSQVEGSYFLRDLKTGASQNVTQHDINYLNNVYDAIEKRVNQEAITPKPNVKGGGGYYLQIPGEAQPFHTLSQKHWAPYLAQDDDTIAKYMETLKPELRPQFANYLQRGKNAIAAAMKTVLQNHAKTSKQQILKMMTPDQLEMFALHRRNPAMYGAIFGNEYYGKHDLPIAGTARAGKARDMRLKSVRDAEMKARMERQQNAPIGTPATDNLEINKALEAQVLDMAKADKTISDPLLGANPLSISELAKGGEVDRYTIPDINIAESEWRRYQPNSVLGKWDGFVGGMPAPKEYKPLDKVASYASGGEGVNIATATNQPSRRFGRTAPAAMTQPSVNLARGNFYQGQRGNAQSGAYTDYNTSNGYNGTGTLGYMRKAIMPMMGTAAGIGINMINPYIMPTYSALKGVATGNPINLAMAAPFISQGLNKWNSGNLTFDNLKTAFSPDYIKNNAQKEWNSWAIPGVLRKPTGDMFQDANNMLRTGMLAYNAFS